MGKELYRPANGMESQPEYRHPNPRITVTFFADNPLIRVEIRIWCYSRDDDEDDYPNCVKKGIKRGLLKSQFTVENREAVFRQTYSAYRDFEKQDFFQFIETIAREKQREIEDFIDGCACVGQEVDDE